MRALKLIWRAGILLAIWGIAAVIAAALYHTYTTHAALDQKVRAMREQHAAKTDEYASTLVAGRKLRHDPEQQVKLMKDKLGYARPDEIPIVVEVSP